MRRVLDESSIPFRKAIKKQNPIELLFKDLKHFDTNNPVIGNLIRKVDIGKKNGLSKFLSQAPDVKDLELQSRLNKHHSRNEYFNGGDYNNNNLFIPPPPLPQPPQPLNIPVPPPFQVICLTIIGLHHCLCCHLQHQQGNHSICLFSIMNRHQYFQIHQQQIQCKQCPGTG